MNDNNSTLNDHLRQPIEWVILLLAATIVLRAWFLEGFPWGCQVVGGSMAETLLGTHREVICADCGHSFICDAALDSAACRAVCPNCGYAGNRLDASGDLAGDRVLIDRGAFLLRPPRRWEVVALRQPGQPGATCVKRVVGLPGETIQIRHGDVYADGRIQRKTLAQQRAMAVLVHDAKHLPTLEPLPARWQAESPHTAWDTAGGRFTHAATPDEKPVDWLMYHHGRRSADSPGSFVPAPVNDICGYNQGRPRREEDVHAVADLLLSLRLVKTAGAGSLFLWASDGREEFQAEIDPQRERYEVLRNGQPLPDGSGRLPSSPTGLLIEVSLFDQKFLLGLGGRTVVACPYERPDLSPAPPSEPLGIGAERLEAVVDDVRMYRDVYYTRPIWAGADANLAKPVRLGAGEYFVLGDNSPISEDSRTWTQFQAVSCKSLIGKPLAVVFPARHAQLGPWHFQVPDLGRIRYIR